MNRAPRALPDGERIDWLRLILTPRIGPTTFRELLSRYGSAAEALAQLPELSRRAGTNIRAASVAQAEREMKAAAQHGARIIAMGEPDYPDVLAQLDYPPPLLSVWGSTSVLAKPAVAIVGSRNASAAGAKMARLLARDLGVAGFAVISGLARGIDAAAHQGALATGTIGVLAGGIDRPYPPENLGLYRSIADNGGAVVSEMPWGWEARAQDFPRRNRIVAGMALGLVVVEAALRSGSLISARLAGEMGRLVFAVPGSPLDPRAVGTNKLLKDGAMLVTEAIDIIEQLRPLRGPNNLQFITQEASDLGSFAESDDLPTDAVLRALGVAPIQIDDLSEHTGLSSAQVRSALLELELAGRIERHSGGAVSALLVDA